MNKATLIALSLGLLLSSPTQALALDLDKEIQKQNQASKDIMLSLSGEKKSNASANESAYEKKEFKVTLIRVR